MLAILLLLLLPAGRETWPALTLLRGNWEYHTYDERWMLEFTSDRVVEVNHRAAAYSLDGNELSIPGPDGPWLCTITPSNDALEVVLPDGRSVRLTHRDAGKEEGILTGRFTSYGDTLAESFLFDGERNFSFHSEGEMRSGVYRVEGNSICLVFVDSSTAIAEIMLRDPEGKIVELVYGGVGYGSDDYAPVPRVVYVPPPVWYPCIDCGDRPSPPPEPIPGGPPGGAGPSQPAPQPEPSHTPQVGASRDPSPSSSPSPQNDSEGRDPSPGSPGRRPPDGR